MLGSTNCIASKIINPLVHTQHSCNKVVLDTGATHHFFSATPSPSNDLPLTDLHPVSNGINVLLPNHDKIQATHTANLNVPHLPSAARNVHLFPSLASGSLLSVGQLCDSGCTATFTNTTAPNPPSHQYQYLLPWASDSHKERRSRKTSSPLS